MALQKVLPRPGVNRENTRYTNEGGWYECDKVRFRYGTPEKIGGWQALSTSTYLGVCRSLWAWSDVNGAAYLGMGTNIKYYISWGGTFYDVTPVRATTTLPANPFTGNGTTTVTVNAPLHGATDGSYVTFSGVTGTYATLLNTEYQITYVDANSYTITTASVVAAGTTGGSAVSAAYQVNIGDEIANPLYGWGAGGWGFGGWGTGAASTTNIRIWNAQNFGQDLIYGPKSGALYYWDVDSGLTSRGVALSSMSGASDVPATAKLCLVSDTSRFVLAFGCEDYGAVVVDPMLIRWSAQENAVNWTPSATNQAGSLRLSHGSTIQAVAQVRQEILVWTDTSLYSLQYLGPPIVWGSQLLGDNISIVSDRAAVNAAGVTYWMGDEKFYVYDGRINTLSCDLRQYVFGDFNSDQVEQVFASTVQQFNEVWWFYCSSSSTTIDRYVVYNYQEKIWYYGQLDRTAWIDTSVVDPLPIAATYANNLVEHEVGTDDLTTPVPQPIEAYITSSEFDIEDGDRFGFVWRVLPDITFRGSTAASPQVALTLLPLQNSGSGYNSPASRGGSDTGPIVRSATVPIEKFTQQVNIRVRGRQMSMKVASTDLGVQWQLGSCRIDIKQDGRKS